MSAFPWSLLPVNTVASVSTAMPLPTPSDAVLLNTMSVIVSDASRVTSIRSSTFPFRLAMRISPPSSLQNDMCTLRVTSPLTLVPVTRHRPMASLVDVSITPT